MTKNKNKNFVLMLLDYGILVALLLMVVVFSLHQNFFPYFYLVYDSETGIHYGNCMYRTDNGHAHRRH